jgi:enterochelin esterase family protein
MNRMRAIAIATILTGVFALHPAGAAQPPGQGAATGRGSAAPSFASPEVLSDRRVVFRIFSPKADEVRLVGTDIPRNMQGLPMTRTDNGVWELTVGPLEPGAYRYNFNVNGVAVIDPRSPAVSESNNNVWSLVYIPGAEFMDTRDVPHGAVAAVTYHSTALQKDRRMHIYTPPGYELGRGTFPVLYLLHGAGDNDESWTSVGRAGFILDNLIAAQKARPMIVVMPAGHTSRTPANAIGRSATDEFVQDFVQDVVPYVEKHYRVVADRAHRAIAGLSMGGNQTLHVAIPRLDQFAYVGVFSSGLLGAGAGRGAPPAAAGTPPPTPAVDTAWVDENAGFLESGAKKHALKVFWFATGSEDRLMPTTEATVALFKQHGFAPVFKPSGGGHTWLNWRDYLTEFAPQLFQ